MTNVKTTTDVLITNRQLGEGVEFDRIRRITG